MSPLDALLEPVPIPGMVIVKQQFERPILDDIEGETVRQLNLKGVLSLIKPGRSIAIAVGSRGISNQALIVKKLVTEIKKREGVPFIVPAMGSHGGATADGQRDMLVGLGISEEFVGAPINATMDVTHIGTSHTGVPAYIDAIAYAADGIIFINRIKPHVAFRGPYESGMMKMLTIGLGKQKGAENCHNLGMGKMAENIPAIGKVILEKAKILFGIGLIENAYHETCRIEVLKKNEIETVEPDLLLEANWLMPKLYIDRLDVLIIDEIGKNISGTGFDTNVVGRYHTPYAHGGPEITRIACLDLTEQSHGNANGLGILDFTTMRAYKKFNFEQTYPNSLTSTVPTSVKIPMVLKNDKQAIQAAIKTCNILEKEKVRLMRIKNTISLGEIEISESLIEEADRHKDMQIVGDKYDFPFDDGGNLL